MKLFKKFLFLFLLTLPFFGGGFVFAKEWSIQLDFLQQVYDPAIQWKTVVWWERIGTTKQSVWNHVLNWGFEVKCKNLKCKWSTKSSLLVVATQFLVRFTLIIAITMIIYNGILFVIRSTKGEMSKDTLKSIAYIALWILIALASITIINLANSVWTTLFEMDAWTNTALGNVELVKETK